MSGLLPHHAELLAGSAISDVVARERGYWSAEQSSELDRYFGPTQRRLVPALVIPTHDVFGDVAFCQLRPDAPRVADGRTRKYEMPARSQMVIDVPPRVRRVLSDPHTPLVITEGARKADAAVTAGLCAIDLVGVWTWRGRNSDGGLTALPDFESIALNERVVYLAFDSDAMQKREVHQALERLAAFLRKRGADLRFVYLPSGDGGAKVGLDDYLAAGNTRDDVLACASNELRPLAGEQKTAPKPAAPLVATEQLITSVAALIGRFVILPNRAAALTLALWVMHTWAFDAAHATPYLVIQSPVKRAGKTRLEEVLELVVRAPWRIAAASEAAMFRKIDAERPTLLLDEVDALFASKTERTEPVRAIIDAGNRPGGSVARVAGEGAAMAVVDFSVYCPKVLAGINTTTWPDTIIDRSIVIQLKRKKSVERVERMRYRSLRAETEPLRAALERWAAEHAGPLRNTNPELPDDLDDRSAEGWEPLFAIAELADHEHDAGWTKRAHLAATSLAVDRGAEDDSPATMALAAMRAIFGDAEVISTATATATLNHDDDLPFGDYRRGAGLDGRGLARLLKPFGIRSRGVRIGSATPRGYRRDDFTDGWERYCKTPAPRTDAVYPQQAQQANDGAGFQAVDDPQQTPDVADVETGENARQYSDVADVADRNGNARAARADGSQQLTEDDAAALTLDLFPGSTEETRNSLSACERIEARVNPDCAATDAVERIPLAELTSCAYPERARHRDHHRPHPDTGRVICWLCHPPAQNRATRP